MKTIKVTTHKTFDLDLLTELAEFNPKLDGWVLYFISQKTTNGLTTITASAEEDGIANPYLSKNASKNLNKILA